MQHDLEALEIVCKHYNACHGNDALRKEKNRIRALQRRLAKLEAENLVLKGANRRWQAACQEWRLSYQNVNSAARNLVNVLQTQHWL